MTTASIANNETRQWHGESDAEYILPSDQREAERFALQHKVITGAFENRLTTCPTTGLENSKVLDCGAGSGVWTVDMARDFPSASFIGLDIADHLFPPSPPSNTKFEKRNLRYKLPEEWTDTFSLIHQRLLLVALLNDEWPAVIAEYFRVCKPGGYIQLSEIDGIVKQPGKTTEVFLKMEIQLFKAKGMDLAISARLETLLKEAGFQDVKIECRKLLLSDAGGELGTMARKNFLAVFSGFKTPILANNGFGVVKSAEEYDAMIEDMRKEWTDGQEYFNFYIASAKKPETR